ncbi:hypothetical protein [Bradyrhizobium vignae]|uniref:hypothetical protein n=1 Tax=Bradyrhizobium vignae TaxID=1549949 RepID=UPI00100BFBF5|nr:hypothetical protein [Bradyrhizobium vignae]RXH05958.1 hypothetical protein EAV90_05465 [Bradyrhizobium vignae]
MMDREKEVERLNEADRHIATGELAVSKQIALIEKLKQDGHDISQAVKQLHDFQNGLDSMREHRSHIVQMIDQIDRGLA